VEAAQAPPLDVYGDAFNITDIITVTPSECFWIPTRGNLKISGLGKFVSVPIEVMVGGAIPNTPMLSLNNKHVGYINSSTMVKNGDSLSFRVCASTTFICITR
jgi:hypothetical protein